MYDLPRCLHSDGGGQVGAKIENGPAGIRAPLSKSIKLFPFGGDPKDSEGLRRAATEPAARGAGFGGCARGLSRWTRSRGSQVL